MLVALLGLLLQRSQHDFVEPDVDLHFLARRVEAAHRLEQRAVDHGARRVEADAPEAVAERVGDLKAASNWVLGEFQAHLGIAPNVLTQRLQDLVAHGILQVTATCDNGRALDYRLSDKGRDLLPVIVALAQWGDRHAPAQRRLFEMSRLGSGCMVLDGA